MSLILPTFTIVRCCITLKMQPHRLIHRNCAAANVCQETPYFIVPNVWPTNSPDLNTVDYQIWAVMQHRVYQRQIRSVDELKRRLINVWCGLQKTIFDEAIDQWRGRLRAGARSKGGHFGYRL